MTQFIAPFAPHRLAEFFRPNDRRPSWLLVDRFDRLKFVLDTRFNLWLDRFDGLNRFDRINTISRLNASTVY